MVGSRRFEDDECDGSGVCPKSDGLAGNLR